MRQCYWYVRQHIALGTDSTNAAIALGRLIYGDRTWNWRGDQNKLIELFLERNSASFLIALSKHARAGPGGTLARDRLARDRLISLEIFYDHLLEYHKFSEINCLASIVIYPTMMFR